VQRTRFDLDPVRDARRHHAETIRQACADVRTQRAHDAFELDRRAPRIEHTIGCDDLLGIGDPTASCST